MQVEQEAEVEEEEEDRDRGGRGGRGRARNIISDDIKATLVLWQMYLQFFSIAWTL